MGWVTEDAPRRSELDACVQCGLCLPHCPTFRLTGDEVASPRGRLAAMAAVASGAAEVDDVFEDVMTFCLQCRACEAACPSLVPFGRAMEGARAELAAQRPGSARRSRHWLLGRMVPSRPAVRAATALAAAGQRTGAGRWLPGAAGRGLRGLRSLDGSFEDMRGRSWGARGPEQGTVGLLAGCVMGAWFEPVHVATVEVLRLAGYRVVVPPSQTCCGALAAHDGALEPARELAARNTEAFRAVDLIVVNAAGCGAHLREYGEFAGSEGAELAARVRDVTELVAEALAGGRLPTARGTGPPVAMQDPCHLRHAQRIVRPPRMVVEAAGHPVVEIDPDGMCCGAAGVYTVLRPEASAELGRRKAAQVESSGARIVASANPGCEMQLRTHLGSEYRIAHPIELYWEAAVQATQAS